MTLISRPTCSCLAFLVARCFCTTRLLLPGPLPSDSGDTERSLLLPTRPAQKPPGNDTTLKGRIAHPSASPAATPPPKCRPAQQPTKAATAAMVTRAHRSRRLATCQPP